MSDLTLYYIAEEFRDIRMKLDPLIGLNVPAYLSATTYQPTYLGGSSAGATTYTLQDGFYILINELVLFWGRVAWTAASGTGVAQISLPFTVATAASGTNRASGSLYVSNVTIGTFSPEMLISQGAAFFTMGQPANNAGNTAIVVEAAGDIIFSGFFPK